LAFSDGKGLVAGTSSALAVHAGTEALRKGGNAVDACLTTALTEIALAAGSHVSYAGAANILYYDSSTGDTYNIDGGWNKPYYIDPAQIPEHHSDRSNGASVLVPGFIAAVSSASEKYGILPLSKLLEPALYFATKGFRLPAHLAEEIRKNYNPSHLLRTKEGKYIFTNLKTKKLYKAGERFRQPKLAKFLKRLSKHGKDYFYRGAWAEDMVETVQSQDGYVTMEDMTEYHVRQLEPASTMYYRYHVLTSGAEWGGAELVENLNLMELAGIGGSTDSYLTNATKLFWLASITRVTSFISFFTHAVPNGKSLLKEHLGVDVDGSDRRTKDAAEELWDKIGSAENMKEINDLMREMIASVEMDMERYEHGSSGVVAVDRSGNVCSLVHGTDSRVWGSGLFVQGVSLPSTGIALKSLLKGIRSGSRVPSGLQPLIIFKEEFPEFNEFRRRLRRDVSMAKKHRKSPSHKRKGFKHHGHPVVDVPQKLVVLRTYNGVRSHLEEGPFAKASRWQKSPERKQLEHLTKPAGFEENDEEDEQAEYSHTDVPFGERPSTQERKKMRDTVETQTKLSSHRQPPASTKDELEELHPTDSQVRPHPMKPVPRRPHYQKDRPDVTTNLTNGEEEGEEVENEIEEEEEEEKEETLGQEKEEGKILEEEEILDEEPNEERESKEFPHLGIPHAWEADTISEEKGEPAFHTGSVPVLALTCTGPSHPLVIPQYLTNILDSGMNPKAALEAPTFLVPSSQSFQQDIQVEKYAIDENILEEVGEFGQPLTEVDTQTAEEVAGIGAAITLSSDGKMLGCAHPSKEGLAEGVSVLLG